VEQFDPTIQIIKGDGNWYWAHSMYQAQVAICHPYDAIMWLNDDTELSSGSLERIDGYFALTPNSILIGQFKGRENNNVTYGGYIKYDRHPFHFKQVYARDELIPCDTFNGNLVFIPYAVSDKIGKIDGGFAHAYADLDFGLRASALGIKINVVPGFVGICDTNPQPKFENLIEEIKALMSAKSSPIRSQIRFLKKHGRWNWPIYLVAPFIKRIIRQMLKGNS
jgi:GT2 family glycosyltransferase